MLLLWRRPCPCQTQSSAPEEHCLLQKQIADLSIVSADTSRERALVSSAEVWPSAGVSTGLHQTPGLLVIGAALSSRSSCFFWQGSQVKLRAAAAFNSSILWTSPPRVSCHDYDVAYDAFSSEASVSVVLHDDLNVNTQWMMFVSYNKYSSNYTVLGCI